MCLIPLTSFFCVGGAAAHTYFFILKTEDSIGSFLGESESLYLSVKQEICNNLYDRIIHFTVRL